MNTNYLPSDYLPIVVQLLAALGFIVGSMLVSHNIGPKRHSKKKDDPFECGIPTEGDARTPISVKYFLVAILFVLFDVEIIFLYPWAVNFLDWMKESREMAIAIFVEMILFMGLLLVGFYYIIRKGVLNWNQ
ncbi:MAG: NADH-quinone oxidoreductase subunit A [Cytophagaceae bacterium]|nr:NADH-quinone oxidoreductase subunit A [Cytophagaceae bacterium]